jgi:hypothetical protein
MTPDRARDILSIVLYFDVFAWPLTRAELARFVAPGDPAAVDRVVGALVAEGRLAEAGGFVFLPGGEPSVERRRQAARRAEATWPSARRAAAVLARFPFVRAVLVTGGLSKGSAADDSDVDFLLVVEPGRVWLTKTMLQVVRKGLPRPIRECLCTNYLVAADHLLLDDRNAYTAIELVTAVPMYNGPLCAAFLEANAWARDYVPGFEAWVERAHNAPDLPGRPAADRIERWLEGSGEALDRRALHAWDRYWNHKYAWLDDATRAQRFKRRPELSTNHLHDFQFRVLDAWSRRLRAHGIEA